MSDVTQILRQIDAGDPAAADQLLPLVYDELQRLAAQRMSAEKAGHSLDATALVHEAYLRLVENNSEKRWDSRGHFFSAAAEAMRRILIESARRRLTTKRNAGSHRLDVDQLDPPAPGEGVDLLALDEAVQRLASIHPRKAEFVKLRYFAGLTAADAASCLGISHATAERDWAYAKAWLRRELMAAPGDDAPTLRD
jgi:RNA polymerase sigma factor (TIGR02999 family)